MNAPLDLLRMGLRPFASGLRAPESISDPSGMTRAKQQVQREHGGAGIVADSRSIQATIAAFRRSGKVEGFRDLKYVCLGMGAIDSQGWCAIADAKLRSRVIELVEGQVEMRRRIRCFQALLSSYWAFPLNAKHTSEEAKAGWRELRSWLLAERERILRSKEPKPPWFAALTKHAALLTDQPCDKFGAALLRGDSSELRDAMDSLAIPTDSWVLEEAVIAQMRAGCGLADEPFKETLPNLINIGTGRGVELGTSLQLRCVSLLVSRYARCRERPEHMALRDAAVSIVGNPWLRRANWDAWVVDARGKPDDQSREMVNAWLKRELIKNFFELLSVDGTGDSRRVDYWLRFEPVIEEMWFALGSDGQDRRGEAFKDFRSRAKGRLLDLDGTTADNNAFVMRVGRYLLVEFGAKGNAMYVFEWDSLGQPLLNTLTSGRARDSVSIHRLKDSNNIERLIHRDSAGQPWEKKFDDSLVPRIGRRPTDAPRRVKVVRHPRPEAFSPDTWGFFARTHGLHVEDNRSRQGALWVLGVEQPAHVVVQLEAWGFRARYPRGWFKE